MANLGLDFAGRPPAASAIKAAGYTFVMRYLSRYTSKVITKGEYDDDMANGVGVGLVFEDYANQALNGYAQGVSDAQFALNQARGVGFPDNRPIYFAVDFDINDAQKPAAAQYMKGVASVIGLARVGAYGGYWWVKYCFDNGLATWGWQAVAWSGGNREQRAHLFQRLGGVNVGGTNCDVNEQLKADAGFAGGDMPDLVNEDTSKILQHGVIARNGLRGRAYALDGSTGTPWVGAPLTNQFIQDIFSSPEGRQWRDSQDPASVNDINARLDTIPVKDAQIATLTEANTKLTAQIKELEAGGTGQSNGTVVITQKGWAALWVAIKTFFSKNN